MSLTMLNVDENSYLAVVCESKDSEAAINAIRKAAEKSRHIISVYAQKELELERSVTYHTMGLVSKFPASKHYISDDGKVGLIIYKDDKIKNAHDLIKELQ